MSETSNKELAAVLRELAGLLELGGADRYRVSAYYNASRNIMRLTEDISQLADKGELREIRGIGKGLANTIREIIDTGSSSLLEELRAELPDGLLELINIPGLGPKRAHQLYYKLGIKDISELEEALKKGKVRKLKGFGPASEKKLLNSLQEYLNYRGVFLLPRAYKKARELLDYLKELPELKKVDIAGSIRRHRETVADIKLLLICDSPERLIEHLEGFSGAAELIVRSKESVLLRMEDGLQAELWMVSREVYPAALIYFTGSREHLQQLSRTAEDKGYQLEEKGLFKGEERTAPADEAELYKILGMDYIIPELREGRGEVEAAGEGRLPKSIELRDIRGDLHLHSQYSDGACSIREMADAARKRGYRYLAITDHSASLQVANGLSPRKLRQQQEEIERLQAEYDDIRILKGTEVDIKADGSLDYTDQLLSELDFVLASVHSVFNLSEEKMTERIIRAVENPLVRAIGHPHGRLLKTRKGYRFNLDRVLEAARDTGTCLEINSSPYRLDLDDRSVKKAREYGVKIVINTDAHHIKELDYMELGVAVARRGWLEKGDVLNTMSLAEIEGFLGI